MKALTVYQPYASLICPGPKRIENRSWTPPKSLIGKRIAIHAGKTMDWTATLAYLGIFIKMFGKDFSGEQLPRGAIVGTAIVWGHVTRASAGDDEWFVGPIGWSLSDVWTLREPIPFRGAQGLWDLPLDLSLQLSQNKQEFYHPVSR